MSGLNSQQISKIAQFLVKEHGPEAVAEDFTALLKRTLTVGTLKKALEGMDDSLPVELEVVLDISDEGECTTQPGFAVHTYQIQESGDGSGKFAIVAALPDNVEAYAEAFELPPALKN
jgi:hypothetical protein